MIINLHTDSVPSTRLLKYNSARCFRPEEEQYSKTRSSEGQSRLFCPGWQLCRTLSSTLSRHSSNLPQLFAKILTICTSGWKKNPPTLGLLARKDAQRTSWFIRYNCCLSYLRRKTKSDDQLAMICDVLFRKKLEKEISVKQCNMTKKCLETVFNNS